MYNGDNFKEKTALEALSSTKIYTELFATVFGLWRFLFLEILSFMENTFYIIDADRPCFMLLLLC